MKQVQEVERAVSNTQVAQKTILITGGAGFFGGVLKRDLLERGHRCVSVDVCRDEDEHPKLSSNRLDIRDANALDRIFSGNQIDGVIHCAAVLAHGSTNPQELWSSNVEGTRNVLESMRKHSVKQLVFTSTNCLWGRGLNRPVREDDAPEPIEIYGRSKDEGEQLILKYPDINSVIIRCPTIVDFGRLGLLAILFEFIHEGRRVWTVGGGKNRYQFIYAKDLANACLMALDYPETAVFNIGSDDVKSLAAVYQYVVGRAGSQSKVSALPLKPTIAAMKLAFHLKISPLGPYHYKMIAEDFVFDTARIKRELGWRPTLTNEQMLWRAYQYYAENRAQIEQRQDVSAHKRGSKMGVIRLLKWMS